MCDSFIGAYETGPVTTATILYIRGTSETIARILQTNSDISPHPPPPKKKNYISIVLNFSRDNSNSQEELKTKGMHFLGGGGWRGKGIRCIMGDVQAD